jgi:hypothetical protein
LKYISPLTDVMIFKKISPKKIGEKTGVFDAKQLLNSAKSGAQHLIATAKQVT